MAFDLSGADLSPSGFLDPPPPHLQGISSPPLVAALSILSKSAESPGSGHMGAICALVFLSI